MKIKFNLIRWIMCLMFIISLIIIYTKSPFNSLSSFTRWLETIKTNECAYFIYIIVSIVCSIFFVPLSWLRILGGILFGFWPGILIAWIASNISTNICFLLYRMLGKDFISKILNTFYKNKDSLYFNISDHIEKNGSLLVANMQMIPILPFFIINIACALSDISYKNFALGSLWGLLPGTLITVYFSSNAIHFKENPYSIILPTAIFITFNILIYLLRKNKKTIIYEDTVTNVK
ncbi:MAG: TVP38/TMEM64 family protein [Eubacteriales bacterium]